MISLRALNRTDVGGHNDCLYGSAMISLRALDGTGGWEEDDCLDG